MVLTWASGVRVNSSASGPQQAPANGSRHHPPGLTQHVCFGAADTRFSCSPMALPTDFWAIVFALFPMVLIPCLSSISRKGGVLARMPIPLMSCGGQQKGNREPHPGLGETRKGWGNSSSSSSKHFLPGRGGLGGSKGPLLGACRLAVPWGRFPANKV